MRIPVFVSCPTALDKRQDQSRDRIIQELSRLQLEPRALGRSDYPSDCPLREVFVIAKHCSGGIILGFRQFVATAGVSKPGTKRQSRLGRGKTEVFPSPWNHLEAGILFGLQMPLLIFREEPIRGGVFDDGVTDVFIHSMPPGDLPKDNLEAFREVLLKWSARVRERYYRTG
ncbi:MAG: hypothetical protein ACRD3G_00750 [Vicinamibacterales bacterium]